MWRLKMKNRDKLRKRAMRRHIKKSMATSKNKGKKDGE